MKNIHLLAKTFSVLLFLITLGCGSVEKDLDKAIEKNTEQAYREFIKTHENHPLVEEAKKRLELVLFESAIQSNDRKNIEKFLSEFPEGAKASEAKKHLELVAFQSAINSNNKEALENFLAEFPNGEKQSEAQKQLDQLILESTRIDGKVFISKTNKPLPNALIFLKKPNLDLEKKMKSALRGLHLLMLTGDAQNDKNVVTKARSDKNGFFTFTKVKTGVYYLLVRIDDSNATKGCVRDKDGWISIHASIGTSDPATHEAEKYSPFLAARGKSFQIKAGEQLQMDIDFECK